MKENNLQNQLIILLYLLTLTLFLGCTSYSSSFNKIYKAHKKIETDKDFGVANNLLKDVERKKKGKKNIQKHKTAFYYSKARINFDKGKYSKAKQMMDEIIATYSSLSSKDKKALKRKNIDEDELNKFYSDILAVLPPQLPKPYENPLISKAEFEKAKKEKEEYMKESSLADVYNRTIDEFNKAGVKLPENSNLLIERKGENAEDVLIKYEYGDNKGDYANVDISAFGRGKYITERSKNALIIFKEILKQFVQEEKDVDYNDVKITVTGSADGHPVNYLLYKGEFGDIKNEKFYDVNSGEYKTLNLSQNDNIKNESLAFLRAYHPKYKIKEVKEFLSANFLINAEEKIETGGVYRKVFIEIYMKNAYKLNLEKLSSYARVLVKKQVEKKPPPLPKEFEPKIEGYKGKKTAIVVGISDYKNLKSPTLTPSNDGLMDLEYADDDADDFADMLERDKFSGGGWDIKKYTNSEATNGIVTSTLQDVLLNSNEDDLIFIFFSGHGKSHQLDRNDVYLLPYDYNRQQISSSSIKYGELLEWVAEARAEHIILFIDACKSGAVGFAPSKGKLPNYTDDFLFERIKSFPKTKVIFSSSTGSQTSFESGGKIQNGLFTYYLLEGLYGKAENKNKNSFVDLGEVFFYVRENVERKSVEEFFDKQTPSIIHAENYLDFHFPITNRYN